MLKRYLLLLMLAAIPARAADIYACYNGSAQQGGQRVKTNGVQSSAYFQGSYPLTTVTVYNHGTTTTASIFTDGTGATPLINPFTSTSTGVAFWCAADGAYDVKYSGTTITAPFTVSGIRLSLNGGGGGGGGSGTVGPGTVGHLLKFSTSTTAADANCVDSNGTGPTTCGLGVSVSSTALFASKVNNTSTGTTANLLLARDSSGRAINAQPTDTSNLIGIAGFGAGTSGSVTYAYSGNFACIFDNQTQINDWTVLGANSQCHDAGATEPSGVQNMGRITSINAGAGTMATIDMGLPDVNPQVNGGVGNCANAAGPITYYTLAQLTGCDPAMTTDGAGNLQAVSGTFSGSGSGFVAFGQGVAPSSLAANTAYLSGPASVVTSFNTTLPATPGTAGQFLEIDTVPSGSQITTKWASSAGCPQGTCLINAPTGDQTITGSGGASNLINEDQGGFIAADTPNTDATLGVFMDAFNTGQGAIAYSKPSGPVSTSIRFNAPGAITLNPVASGADDAAHGVVLNNSGLTIVSDYTDGYGLVMTAGNVLIQGGALATGNPLITLGSTGVEGVIKTVPASGGGSYLFRFPTTASNRSITAIDKSGDLVLSAAALGNSLGVCTDINGLLTTSGCSTGGSVTSVGLTVNSTSPSGIFTVTGSPVTTSGTLNFNLAGTSGGVPYFSSASVLSSSAALTANGVVLGGGAGAAPTVTSADSTTTHALFATAGAPAFRAIAAGDIPTLNQNTTGSAAKWTTARNLAGNSVDGSADVAFANKFIVQGTVDAGLSAAQFLGALATGILKNTTTTGVLSIATGSDLPTAIPIASVGSAGLSGTSPVAIASTGAISCATCVVASSPGAGIAHFAGSTQTVTSSAVVGSDMTNNTVTSTQLAVVNTRRVCDMAFGDTSGSALTNGQLGPQKRMCFIPYAATVVEIDVAADGGTPNIIVGRSRAGVTSNLLSGALATASAGGIACSNTGGTTGLDGATTCTNTLQNTGTNIGDYFEAVSGTAGGTAKFMTVHIVYTVN